MGPLTAARCMAIGRTQALRNFMILCPSTVSPRHGMNPDTPRGHPSKYEAPLLTITYDANHHRSLPATQPRCLIVKIPVLRPRPITLPSAPFSLSIRLHIPTRMRIRPADIILYPSRQPAAHWTRQSCHKAMLRTHRGSTVRSTLPILEMPHRMTGGLTPRYQ